MAAGKRGGIVESGQAGYRDLLACCENSGGLHFFRSQRSEPPQIDLRTPLRGDGHVEYEAPHVRS
jgi:hypothetical protein